MNSQCSSLFGFTCCPGIISLWISPKGGKSINNTYCKASSEWNIKCSTLSDPWNHSSVGVWSCDPVNMVKRLLLKELVCPFGKFFPYFSNLGVFGGIWRENLVLISENNLFCLDIQKVYIPSLECGPTVDYKACKKNESTFLLFVQHLLKMIILY